jgi:4-carboxymuconolactone decarboxylase
MKLPRIIIVTIGLLAVTTINRAKAQESKLMVRIARIIVDSANLGQYRAALKEGIETAVRVEPGVQGNYERYGQVTGTR